MLIIPSKELLLITAEQSKQIFLFDPKTTSVITKYHTEPTIGKTVAYYPHANQFITSYNNKTFVSIWSTDCQQPINKVSTVDMITFMLISRDKNILFAGSQNGNLYIWELPSGMLIRKVSIHSGQIKKIIEYKPGYIMTSSKNEIKIWSLASFYIETERSTAIKIINFILDIIDIEYVRNIFAVLTCKSVTYYLGGNEHNPFPQINKEDMQFPTRICASMSHLYIGDFQGSIHANEVITNQNTHEINFDFNQANQQAQVSKVGKKLVLKGQNKHPITCLIHMKTVPYLISGNTEGDVLIWHNNVLKKSVKLFKTSIKFIHNIPKPLQQKITLNLKLRPMAKYEQNKETEPLEVDIQRLLRYKELNALQSFDLQKQVQSIEEDASNQLILQRMLQVLNRPQEILRGKICQLEEQKQMLIKANLHFSQILAQQKGLTKQNFDF